MPKEFPFNSDQQAASRPWPWGGGDIGQELVWHFLWNWEQKQQTWQICEHCKLCDLEFAVTKQWNSIRRWGCMKFIKFKSINRLSKSQVPFIFLIPDTFIINTHLTFVFIYHCRLLCFQALPVWSMKCRYSKLAKIRRTITEVCTDRQEVIITQWQPYFNLRIRFQSKALAIGYKVYFYHKKSNA